MTHIELEGQTIADRYRVHEQIGEGGMGSVFRAYDQQLQRDVALKVLRKEWADRPEVLRRLDRECLHTAKIGAHSNIVSLYDRLEHEGSVILVIEYVPGEPLDTIIKRTAEQHSSAHKTVPFDGGALAITLSPTDALSIATQCLVGLSHAHGCGVVHRDIKPSNILVSRNHNGALQAKILDFGIGKAMQGDDDDIEVTALTRTDGPGPGSPPYMAPEQIASAQFGEITPRTDLYAMGITLYEMLTLRLPFDAKTVTEFLHAHTSLEPRNPRDLGVELPAGMAAVLQRALRKLPDERYQTAEEFRMDLEAVKTSGGTLERTSGGTLVHTPANYSTAVGSPRKKRMPVAALAGVAVLLLIGAAAAFAVLGMGGGEEVESASGGEPAASSPGTAAASVVPAPEPASSPSGPIDDGAVTAGPSPSMAESAKREADNARTEARGYFPEPARPEDNQNYRLGVEAYDQAETLQAAGNYFMAAEHYKDAAGFFEGARPRPDRPTVAVESPRPEPEQTQTAPPPRPAQVRQEAPAASAPATQQTPQPTRPVQVQPDPDPEPSNPFARIRATPTPDSD
jgi:serine/threonine protein kinase